MGSPSIRKLLVTTPLHTIVFLIQTPILVPSLPSTLALLKHFSHCINTYQPIKPPYTTY